MRIVWLCHYFAPEIGAPQARLLELSRVFRDEGHAVAVGRQGDIYVAGAYNGAVDFDPDVGVDNRTAAGQADAFVVRLDRLRLDAARIYLPAVSVAQVTQ